MCDRLSTATALLRNARVIRVAIHVYNFVDSICNAACHCWTRGDRIIAPRMNAWSIVLYTQLSSFCFILFPFSFRVL